MSTNETFNRLRAQPGVVQDADIDALFATLDVFKTEDIHSRWKGGDFNTGHWASPLLTEMKWFGKWFKSDLDAKPLVCHDEQGKLYSNTVMRGEASLWMIEFRGKVSAAMVYDGEPIFDHFRKVDDDTILGIMNGKSVMGRSIVDNGRYYYFYLERIQDFPVEFVDLG